MKRFVIAGFFVLCAAAAHADQLYVNWYDTIRPNGQKRPDAVSKAALAYCDRTVGVQYTSVSPAYQACMATRGYRFVSAHLEKSAPIATRNSNGSVTYNKDSPDRSVGWHTDSFGLRECTYDCDNPEIPGSGYTCHDIDFFGMRGRECDSP